MHKIETKPIDWLKPDTGQARQSYDEAELRLLGLSLKERQIQPILVRPDGTIIAGHRRFLAAKLVCLETLQVIIADGELTPAQVRGIQLTENIHRADLKAYEKWLACRELLELNPGWQGKDLAEHLHLDPSSVTRILSPSKCIEDAQQALKDGKIGISDCYAISKLPKDKQVGLLALRLSGATRDQIEAAGKKVRNGKAQQVRQARVVCPLPTGARIVVTGPEMDLEGLIQALQSALEAARRANKDAIDIRMAEKVWKGMAKAGA